MSEIGCQNGSNRYNAPRCRLLFHLYTADIVAINSVSARGNHAERKTGEKIFPGWAAAFDHTAAGNQAGPDSRRTGGRVRCRPAHHSPRPECGGAGGVLVDDRLERGKKDLQFSDQIPQSPPDYLYPSAADVALPAPLPGSPSGRHAVSGRD